MKKYLYILLAISLSSGFASCSSDNEDIDTPPVIEKEQIVKSQILGTWEYLDSNTGITQYIEFRDTEDSYYFEQKDGNLIEWYKFKYTLSDLSINITATTIDKNYTVSLYKKEDNIYFTDKIITKSKLSIESLEGKTILTIGDSMSATGEWQNEVAKLLGTTIRKHAKGGSGVLGMIDGYGDFNPLSVADVTGVDIITLYGGYNDRVIEHGKIGDLYPANNTISGVFQYAINRINELLKEANNTDCKIIIITPHCAGKYDWCDADGYTEWVTGSGRTLEMMSNKIQEVAKHNSLASVDLWHYLGIDKTNWNKYQKYPTPDNPDFTFIGEYNTVNDLPTGAEKDVAKVTALNTWDNTYIHNGTEWVRYNKYAPYSPFPYNADQLHLNADGYVKLGNYIAGIILLYNAKELL